MAQQCVLCQAKWHMDFPTLTTNLSKLGMTQEEMASALGVSRALVRAARLDPSSANYRKPPAGWHDKLVDAARLRGREFLKLVEELEG